MLSTFSSERSLKTAVSFAATVSRRDNLGRRKTLAFARQIAEHACGAVEVPLAGKVQHFGGILEITPPPGAGADDVMSGCMRASERDRAGCSIDGGNPLPIDRPVAGDLR